MKPNTESTNAASADMPKDRRSEANTRGVEMAVQKPSQPSSNGRMISAKSGTRTIPVR